MLRVIVSVRDKLKTNELAKYGTLISVSPILNIIGMEINPDNFSRLENDDNVIKAELEAIGCLQIT